MKNLIAADFTDVFGQITPPPSVSGITQLGPAGGVSFFISRVIQLIYTVAIVAFVFMVIISAVQWILSGGDKERLAAARARLIHAIIGVTLLALAFVIIKLIGQLTGFEFFAGQNPPYQGGPCPSGQKQC